MNSLSLNQRDRLTVRDENDEEREVFGWATVEIAARVRGSNPVVDQFEPDIFAGDSRMKPEAVTHWLAEEIETEYRVDVRDHDIDVIDPTDEEVDVL